MNEPLEPLHDNPPVQVRNGYKVIPMYKWCQRCLDGMNRLNPSKSKTNEYYARHHIDHTRCVTCKGPLTTQFAVQKD